MKIEIKDLYKEIKKNVILDNVNITLTGGKIYGIQGKNGCGKTMLMRSIAGIRQPEAYITRRDTANVVIIQACLPWQMRQIKSLENIHLE